MAQRESRLSSKISLGLRQHGAFCFKIWANEYMMIGLPDIVGCYRGRFFAFEVKHPETRNDTSRVQDMVMQKIRAAGGISQVVCTLEEALNALSVVTSDPVD